MLFSDNEMVSVMEPNKCQYVVQFKSPAACTQRDVDALSEAADAHSQAEALEQEEDNVI